MQAESPAESESRAATAAATTTTSSAAAAATPAAATTISRAAASAAASTANTGTTISAANGHIAAEYQDNCYRKTDRVGNGNATSDSPAATGDIDAADPTAHCHSRRCWRGGNTPRGYEDIHDFLI